MGNAGYAGNAEMDGVGNFKDLSEERLHRENVGWTAEFVTDVNSSGDRCFLAEGGSGGAEAVVTAAAAAQENRRYHS